MRELEYFTYCSVKHCHLVAESTKYFGLELCVNHQNIIDKWLEERGYSREVE